MEWEGLLIVKLKDYISIVVVILCIAGCVYLCPFSFFSLDSASTKKGDAVLEQLATRDYATIEQQIRGIQERFALAQMDPNAFSARLAGTIIMGDSLSSGLLEYGLLPTNIVLAERGRRSDSIDGDVQTVIQYAPKVIFMQYGINDLTFCRGDAQRFIAQYSVQVEKLKAALPNTRIFINSLTPISQQSIAKNPNYGHVDEFNAALQTMCKKYEVTYIDNTTTIDFSKDVYEYDGIHPYFNYYKLWIMKMITAAGL